MKIKFYDKNIIEDKKLLYSIIVSEYKGKWVFVKDKERQRWEVPAGTREKGEEIIETAKRELYEETGLIAKELTLLGVFSGKDMHNIYPNGDEVSNVDIVYICKSYKGELKCQTGEVENLKFFDISDLPDNIFKTNLPAIEEYISKQK